MSTQVIKQSIPGGIHLLDPVHSSIRFAVSHNGLSVFRSGFGSYEARLIGGDAPRLEGTVDVSSIDARDEQLKGHLLSPEFFDAELHPQLRFTSNQLSVDADGSARVRGELEIAGRKREVEAEGRLALLGADLGGRPRVGLSLEASVDRRDFGLDWQAELPGGGPVLEYEVSIAVELELVKEGD